MKIAYLIPEATYPVNTGGRVVTYNRIKYLSQLGNDIYLFSIIDEDAEDEIQKEHMSAFVRVCNNYNRNKYKRDTYRSLVKYPFAVASRSNAELQRDLERLLTEVRIDVVFCEYPQMYLNIRKILVGQGVKILVGQNNIEYLTMRTISGTFASPLKRFVYWFDSVRLEAYEKRIYKENLISGHIFVSKEDELYFRNNIDFGQAKTFLSPIGADEHTSFSHLSSNDKIAIIVGKMSYRPNVEGVMWFAKNVWSLVIEELPDAKLYIVGKDPDEQLLSLANENIIVTGTVDSVEPYYAMAKVAIIPIFSGGGVKTKLIEAASYRIPIVCTTSGAKGTEFQNGIHARITDDTSEYIAATISALRSEKKAMKMKDEAYKLFQDNYTWSAICKGLDVFMRGLVDDKYDC